MLIETFSIRFATTIKQCNCDRACENRACGHIYLPNFSGFHGSYLLIPLSYGHEKFSTYYSFNWLYHTSYRMQIFYSNTEI